MSPQVVGPIIGIGVALVIILLRNRQARPLNPDQMWILPLIMMAMLAFGIWGMIMQYHPVFDTVAYAVMSASLVLGAVIGWWRGKTINIHRDPATNRLMAQASPLGIAFILVLFGIRYAGRGYFEAHAEEWGINVGIIDIAFFLLAGGLLIVSRVEMWIRAKGIAETGQDPAAA